MGIKPRAASGVRVRRATLADVPAIYAVEKAAYSSFSEAGLCDERQLRLQIETFPQGQLVAVLDGRIVGYAMALIVNIEDDAPWYSYSEITGNGTFSSHTPDGDTLYGADIAVHPKFRGRGIAAALYDGRKRLLRRFNLRRLVAGGRIPGYAAHSGRLTAEEYVRKVVDGELQDTALNAHLKAGFQVRGVHHGYLRDDQSLDYATFLELPNPRFRAMSRRIAAAPLGRPVRKVRVCAAQYQQRRISSWDGFEHQVSFFVRTAEEYHCHFLVFPELFTAQLFSTLPTHLSSTEAIEHLADMGDRYRDMMATAARRTGLHIVGGSHPVRRDGRIYNVAHLFTPSGNIYTQDKLHVTPNERSEYGITPGDGVYVFDTGLARVAIPICYDLEFPELARMLTLAGAELFLVPFSTDERKAYMRVRYAGHARAVENSVYVVLAGNVGNLPQVDNFLINYGTACVLTPSDFMFPTDAIAAAADSQGETVVITDLDLEALVQARELGSVRPLRDRRLDLYGVDPKPVVRVIRTE